MAKRYKDSNQGAKAQVIGYDPRPMLKITPPAGSSDRRVKVYNYVEACRTFPTTFAASDLDPILRRVNPKLRGQIRSTFIVINDDQARPQSRRFGQGAGSGPSAASDSGPSAAAGSGPSAAAGGDDAIDVDDEAEFEEVASGRIDDRRGTRRKASSPLDSATAAKR
jgi:hypothetical protein